MMTNWLPRTTTQGKSACTKLEHVHGVCWSSQGTCAISHPRNVSCATYYYYSVTIMLNNESNETLIYCLTNKQILKTTILSLILVLYYVLNSNVVLVLVVIIVGAHVWNWLACLIWLIINFLFWIEKKLNFVNSKISNCIT